MCITKCLQAAGVLFLMLCPQILVWMEKTHQINPVKANEAGIPDFEYHKMG